MPEIGFADVRGPVLDVVGGLVRKEITPGEIVSSKPGSTVFAAAAKVEDKRKKTWKNSADHQILVYHHLDFINLMLIK